MACATTDVALSLLHGFELRCGGESVSLPLSAQRLLAFLAVRDRSLLRGYVAGMLWPDTSEVRAGANLRSALWRLRRPGCEVVRSTTTHLGLATSVRVDLHESTTMALSVLSSSKPFDRVDPWELSFSGDLLPDWYDDWILIERERFRQLRLHALELLCEQLMAAGRLAEAIEASLAVVRSEPLRESAHRMLIRAHLAAGNHAEGVRCYRLCQRLLHDELGIKPSPQIMELVHGLNE